MIFNKIVCFLFILIKFEHFKTEKVVVYEPSSLVIELNKIGNFTVVLRQAYDVKIQIHFTYGDEVSECTETKSIVPLDPIEFEPNVTRSASIQIQTRNIGHLMIGTKSSQIEIPFCDVIRVDVIHSKVLDIVITVIGWIYFFSWSISFYPQVFLNWKLKDVSGLSFDFIFLNFLGHACYFIFNISLFTNASVQKEYFKLHPRGLNPVRLNDVLFSAHATLLTFIVIVQALYYKHKKKIMQSISLPSKLILIAILLFLLISGIVCASTNMTLLTYTYFFSYVKLGLTLMKYLPQAYKNYKRKSTEGWSIMNVLLDVTGGIFSVLDMFLLSYNHNDWSSIFGSPTKFGLGMFSILFDLLFIVQHFCLYNNNNNIKPTRVFPKFSK